MFRLILATILCASALVGCSATKAAEPLGVTCDQFGATPSVEQSAELAVGSDVQVVLCSNPSTGFAWGEPTIADPTVITVADRAYHAADGASLPIVGAAGGEVMAIRGIAAGTTTLVLSYDQPWDGGTKGAWTYKLTVTVK